MSYRYYSAPSPLLIGYDPFRDLPLDHLARLVEHVVEECVTPKRKPLRAGQPAFDPRLCAKVLVYGYATGVRSSRLLERYCSESLPYLFLTRGDTPSYHTLCSFRINQSDLIEKVWVGLFAVAKGAGLERLGRITIDSTKMRASAGPESVVKAEEYDDVLAELGEILKEAEAADAKDDINPPGSTRLNKEVDRDQMRDILRRVRKDRSKRKHPESQPAKASAPERGEVGSRMKPRIEAAVDAIKEAQAEGLRHVSLTDPDARMMGEGREKRIRECHSFEIAVDNDLLVVGQACQSAVDNPRLDPIIKAVQDQETIPIIAVDADSGYFSGEAVTGLIAKGVDVCIPDASTAGDVHRAEAIGTSRAKTTGTVKFEYHEEGDYYSCPENNTIAFVQNRKKENGSLVREYRAKQDCSNCPLRAVCCSQSKGKRRTLKVARNADILKEHLARFGDPDHLVRYRKRAPAVETVFGFLRSSLGYTRWFLRGKERVAIESRLFKAALQIRRVHTLLTSM
jgi:transposase